MKKIISYFLQGLLFTVPIAATVFVIYKLFIFIDGIIGNQLPYYIPGIGLVIIVLLIILMGYLSGFFVRNPLFILFEKSIERAPLVKIIYSSVKDLIEAFVGEKKRFNRPVLVKLNKEADVQQIGFMTQDDLTHLGLGKEKATVYLPFPYSFMGNLVVVPKENISPINSSGTEIMKFVISGGVTEI